MNFYSIRDLRNETKSICENIRRRLRQAKAMIAFNSMRAVASANGYMSEREIEEEIQAVRAAMREKI